LRAVRDLRERHGDLSRDAFLPLLPALQNYPRVTFGKAIGDDLFGRVASRALVESRRRGSIACNATFRECSASLERDRCVAVQNNEFVRCGEAFAGCFDALIERPLLLDGDRRLSFLASIWPRLRDACRCGAPAMAFVFRNRNGAASLRAAAGWQLSSVTGE